MSLLWIQAAWSEEKPGTPAWDEHGHGGETEAERHVRYAHQVAERHGVTASVAHRAIETVTRAFRDESQVPATKFGFTSAPGSRSVDPDLPDAAWDRDSWHRIGVQDVPLHVPIHATQWDVNRTGMEHNLFHPGKLPPSDVERMGHPDVDPRKWNDADNREYYTNPDNHDGPSDVARMIRQTDGSHVVVDGHHRVAVDLLLGKPKTRARVLDVRNLRVD